MSTPHGMPGIVVVGSVNADIVARVARHPLPGETLLGETMTVSPGGKGANQAVAAARLGSRVALVGAVGDDPFAEPALGGLREAGVDLGAVRTLEGSTGIALITVSADGENTIVVMSGVNGSVDQERVHRNRELIASATVVVVQGETPSSGIRETARIASGRLVVNLAPVIPVDPTVLVRADPLVVNEHEAALVLAQLAGTADGSGAPAAPARVTTEVDEDAMVAELIAHGIPSVVLTVGARGAVVAQRGGALVRVPSPRVEAVDTTGAGDAFVGALAHGLASGRELVDSARFAARVGAYAVRSAGAQPSYPGVDDELPDVDA